MKALLIVFSLLYFSPIGAKVSIQRRMGDRVYVTNFLMNIFGPESKSIVEKKVFNQPHVFGGPCDPYSQHLEIKNDKIVIEGGSERCVTSFFIEYRSPVLRGPSPLRSGAILKACELLVSCESCLESALSKASLKEVSMVSTEQARNLYQLFFPFEEEENWLSIKGSLSKRQKSWKPQVLLELFCKSERWQEL